MDSTMIGAVMSFVGMILAFVGGRATQRANTTSINVETIIKLSKRIDELETRDAEKEKRIDHLETELKRTNNAYGRALMFINQHVTGVEIPNFFETDPKIKRL